MIYDKKIFDAVSYCINNNISNIQFASEYSELISYTFYETGYRIDEIMSKVNSNNCIIITNTRKTIRLRITGVNNRFSKDFVIKKK